MALKVVLVCCCRTQGATLSTCQPAAKPTYHFSTPGLQNSTATAQAAAAGGRRLSELSGVTGLARRHRARAHAAVEGRQLAQTVPVSNGTQAASASGCKRIGYYQTCGTAPFPLFVNQQRLSEWPSLHNLSDGVPFKGFICVCSVNC